MSGHLNDWWAACHAADGPHLPHANVADVAILNARLFKLKVAVVAGDVSRRGDEHLGGGREGEGRGQRGAWRLAAGARRSPWPEAGGRQSRRCLKCTRLQICQSASRPSCWARLAFRREPIFSCPPASLPLSPRAQPHGTATGQPCPPRCHSVRLGSPRHGRGTHQMLGGI